MKPEVTPQVRKALEAILEGFPALANRLKEQMDRTNAIQQEIAAHVSMLHTYGWSIPSVEGLTIQASALPPSAQQAVLQAVQQQRALAPATVNVQPPTATTPSLKPKRGSVSMMVIEMLKEHGLMSAADIRSAIRRRHGVQVGTSTLYRVLGQENVFQATAGRWKLRN